MSSGPSLIATVKLTGKQAFGIEKILLAMAGQPWRDADFVKKAKECAFKLANYRTNQGKLRPVPNGTSQFYVEVWRASFIARALRIWRDEYYRVMRPGTEDKPDWMTLKEALLSNIDMAQATVGEKSAVTDEVIPLFAAFQLYDVNGKGK